MSFYEINVLVSTMLSQEEAIAAIAGIESKVEKYGKAISEKFIDKKKLAYSINKETEAWLIYFNFSPEKGLDKKEVLNAVEKALKSEKNVIRYLIIKKEEPKPVKERPNKKNSEKKLEEVQTKIEEIETQTEVIEKAEESISPSVEPKKKVQLEELDELLDKE
jgi:ribosomal protein S6